MSFTRIGFILGSGLVWKIESARDTSRIRYSGAIHMLRERDSKPGYSQKCFLEDTESVNWIFAWSGTWPCQAWVTEVYPLHTYYCIHHLLPLLLNSYGRPVQCYRISSDIRIALQKSTESSARKIFRVSCPQVAGYCSHREPESMAIMLRPR